jgi:hypothetical protein
MPFASVEEVLRTSARLVGDLVTSLPDGEVGERIHHTDGTDAFRARLDLARAHLEDFGIASVCGYGRVSPAELDDALRAHRACAEELRAGAGRG